MSTPTIDRIKVIVPNGATVLHACKAVEMERRIRERPGGASMPGAVE